MHKYHIGHKEAQRMVRRDIRRWDRQHKRKQMKLALWDNRQDILGLIVIFGAILIWGVVKYA